MDDRRRTAFSRRALASLAATAGLLLLPGALFFLPHLPPGRVEVAAYLPDDLEKYPVAALIGAWLGARSYRALRPQAPFSVARLTIGCALGAGLGLALSLVVAPAVGQLGLPRPALKALTFATIALFGIAGPLLGGVAFFKAAARSAARWRFWWVDAGLVLLLLAWFLDPVVSRFPEAGSLAQREAWSRQHVPKYAALEHLVKSSPVVTDSVGRIDGIAPTAGDRHAAAVEMNGVDLRFALDVVGEKGRGVFRADCTLDETTVYDWRSGSWTFDGGTTEVTAAPALR